MEEYLRVYPDQQTPNSSHNQQYNMQRYLTQLLSTKFIRPFRSDLPTSNRSHIDTRNENKTRAVVFNLIVPG
jgi:hypothetical protein